MKKQRPNFLLNVTHVRRASGQILRLHLSEHLRGRAAVQHRRLSVTHCDDRQDRQDQPLKI